MRRTGRAFFAEKLNLNLMTAKELRAAATMALSGRDFRFTVQSVALAAWPSNLLLVARRRHRNPADEVRIVARNRIVPAGRREMRRRSHRCARSCRWGADLPASSAAPRQAQTSRHAFRRISRAIAARSRASQCSKISSIIADLEWFTGRCSSPHPAATWATAVSHFRTGSTFGSAARSAESAKLPLRFAATTNVEAVIGHFKDDHRMHRNHNAAVGGFVNFYGGDGNDFLSGSADPNERGPVATSMHSRTKRAMDRSPARSTILWWMPS